MSLDKKILVELKTQLLKEKESLEIELRRFAEPNPENTNEFETKFEQIGENPSDNALEVGDYSNKVALEKNFENQIKDINDALLKMEKGTYGICEKTGQEIPLERLRAFPSARTLANV